METGMGGIIPGLLLAFVAEQMREFPTRCGLIRELDHEERNGDRVAQVGSHNVDGITSRRDVDLEGFGFGRVEGIARHKASATNAQIGNTSAFDGNFEAKRLQPGGTLGAKEIRGHRSI
jgi:hypothetical protein